MGREDDRSKASLDLDYIVVEIMSQLQLHYQNV